MSAWRRGPFRRRPQSPLQISGVRAKVGAASTTQRRQGGNEMSKITGTLLAGAMAFGIATGANAKTYYWISHGSPADPVWTYFLQRRRAVGRGHRQHGEHLVPQRRRRRPPGGAARRHRRRRRRHRHDLSPIRAAWSRSRRRPNEAGIPIINFNTPDPTARFDAYVGGDNVVFGRNWAQYLVDNGLVEVGRLRLDAGRGARRHLRRAGGGGDQVGLRAARHHLGGHRRHPRPGRDHHPDVGLSDRQPRQDRRDHRPRRPRHRLDQAGLRPGRRAGRARSRSSAGATRSTPRRRC